MTIPRALEAEIVRLHHAEHWPIGTIATQLRVHHARCAACSPRPACRCRYARAVRLDRAVPGVPRRDAREVSDDPRHAPACHGARARLPGRGRSLPHPDGTAASTAAAEAYLRLRTLPGEQAQVDWAHFGTLTIGRAARPLMAFVMVLSYSRHLFLRFYLGAAMDNFLRGHVAAFEHFQGVGRTLLYDNLRCAVLERRDEAIRFHPTLLELAAHYRFRPRPVARGARATRRDGSSAPSASSATPSSPRAAFATSMISTHRRSPGAQGEAAARLCPEDRDAQRAQRLRPTSSPRLLALPARSLPHRGARGGAGRRRPPTCASTCNDYSDPPHPRAPHAHGLRHARDACASSTAAGVIATHRRSFDRVTQIEDPGTSARPCVAHKRAARTHRAQDRLHHAAPERPGAVPARRRARRAPGHAHPRAARAARHPRRPRTRGGHRRRTARRRRAPRRRASLHRRARPRPRPSPRHSPCTCPTTRACTRSPCARSPVERLRTADRGARR